MTALGLLALLVATAAALAVVPVAMNARSLAAGLVLGWLLTFAAMALAMLGPHPLGAY